MCKIGGRNNFEWSEANREQQQQQYQDKLQVCLMSQWLGTAINIRKSTKNYYITQRNHYAIPFDYVDDDNDDDGGGGNGDELERWFNIIRKRTYITDFELHSLRLPAWITSKLNKFQHILIGFCCCRRRRRISRWCFVRELVQISVKMIMYVYKILIMKFFKRNRHTHSQLTA